jgi:hypothetical protein
MGAIIELGGISVLAMLSVSLWTVRVALTARGSKWIGATVAAVEAVVFATAFSRLVTDLGSPLKIGAYGVGVAAGTIVGIRLDGWIGQYEAGGSDAGKDSSPHSSTTASLSVGSGPAAEEEATARSSRRAMVIPAATSATPRSSAGQFDRLELMPDAYPAPDSRKPTAADIADTCDRRRVRIDPR